jgi:hypothetical protein
VNPESVLEKTTKGAEEIETRKHKLDAKLRPLLIAVNGKDKAGDVAARFAQLGDAGAMLDELLNQGFVRLAAGGASASGPASLPGAADPAKLKRAVAEASRFISDSLGPGGDAITEKLEQSKSLAELNAFLDKRRDMLEQALGKAKAAQFWQKIGPLLG